MEQLIIPILNTVTVNYEYFVSQDRPLVSKTLSASAVNYMRKKYSYEITTGITNNVNYKCSDIRCMRDLRAYFEITSSTIVEDEMNRYICIDGFCELNLFYDSYSRNGIRRITNNERMTISEEIPSSMTSINGIINMGVTMVPMYWRMLNQSQLQVYSGAHISASYYTD